MRRDTVIFPMVEHEIFGQTTYYIDNTILYETQPEFFETIWALADNEDFQQLINRHQKSLGDGGAYEEIILDAFNSLKMFLNKEKFKLITKL